MKIHGHGGSSRLQFCIKNIHQSIQSPSLIDYPIANQVNSCSKIDDVQKCFYECILLLNSK